MLGFEPDRVEAQRPEHVDAVTRHGMAGDDRRDPARGQSALGSIRARGTASRKRAAVGMVTHW